MCIRRSKWRQGWPDPPDSQNEAPRRLFWLLVVGAGSIALPVQCLSSVSISCHLSCVQTRLFSGSSYL